MTDLTLFPLLGLAVLTYVGSWFSLRTHPAWTARTLAVLALATLVSLVAVALTAIATFFTQFVPHHVVHSNLMLSLISAHGGISFVMGLLTLCLVLLASIRLVVSLVKVMKERTQLPRGGIVADGEPFALAIPMRGGRILISTALRDLLTREELAVVYQHEQAHLDRKHHVYMGLAHALVTVLPILSRLEPAMRLAVERWADEEAATVVGNRCLVAETIGKVALSRTTSSSANELGVADHEVSRRVQALLDPDASHGRLQGTAVLGGSGLIASGLASSPLQLHHLMALGTL
ncbi:Zn-dependent protease with chaperone function [Brevibacterium sandarakinum]|uniref:Zn-dependent protease with chaperone function n=1 Tax=Brevibacterium sandarakinum TaxID=629680 RepID=A0A1H1Q0Z8_BRESA|nr:M56 family metallopeptidase [Brevibacterium sandarakinum]SDS16937.1 Zn-dependent protease with chaperone function [Brevibacterium sandarakinum]